MKTFDKFENKYFIKTKIITETGLHIGASKDSISPLDPDNAVVKNSKGKILIPGSSLKGTFRASLESVLKGLGRNVCEEADGKPCIDEKIRKEEFRDDEKWYNHIEENICEVCSVFGSNSFSSRVFFSDAELVNTDNNHLNIRDGVKIRRDTEIASDGAKYNFEYVEPGAVFETEILAENMESHQIGYLIMLFDMANYGLIRFGGKKSAGLGKIKFEYTVSRLTKEDIINVDFEPKTITKEDLELIRTETKNYLKKSGGQ